MRNWRINVDGWQALADLLAGEPTDFQGHSMRGHAGKATDTAWLPDVHADAYKAADVSYTVYSFDTPIAWLAGNMWTVPDVKYSRRTSRHQNIARTALSWLNKI